MMEFQASTRQAVAEWVLGDEIKYYQSIEEIKKMKGIQARMLYDIRVY